MLHYQGLIYILAIIQVQLMTQHHHDLLVGSFGIENIEYWLLENITKTPYDMTLKSMSMGATSIRL